MLLSPHHTHYDITFTLFGTHVRVNPLFWLMAVLFGWDYVQNGEYAFLLSWIVAVFLSILLHEFGHVWAGKTFGSDGHILLYSFGGLALGANDLRVRWQRVIVLLAGPGIQLALYGAIWSWVKWFKPVWLLEYPTLLELVEILLTINLYWALFNLLPVFPLDGGQVSRELCEAIRPRDGFRVALGISIAVAVFIAGHALLAGSGRGGIPYLPTSTYAIILFAMLAVESWQLLQQLGSGPRFDDRAPWER